MAKTWREELAELLAECDRLRRLSDAVMRAGSRAVLIETVERENGSWTIIVCAPWTDEQRFTVAAAELMTSMGVKIDPGTAENIGSLGERAETNE